MVTAKIIGTGSYVPENIVTNKDLEKLVDTSDEWIFTRTGIRERRLSKEGTTHMAVQASLEALSHAGVPADTIDMILVGTATPDKCFPNTACEIQQAVGADHAVCFDLSAACSGFLFAMDTAFMYIANGRAKRVLVIGADMMSKVVDWADRKTCVLFGDGAGAAVLEAAETGIGRIISGSNGKKSSILTCKSRPMDNPVREAEEWMPYTVMDGQEVFKFAVKAVPECIMQLLEESGTEKEAVKYFVLHQANKRIIESVAKRLKVDADKFPMNLTGYGNMSSASIPVLLDELNKSGRLTQGDVLVLAGFGAGLTWGAALLTW